MLKFGKYFLYFIISILLIITIKPNAFSANNHSSNPIHSSEHSSKIIAKGVNHSLNMHQAYTNKITKMHLLGKDKNKTISLESHTKIKVIMFHQSFTLIRLKRRKGYIDSQSIQKKDKLDIYLHKIKDFLRFKDLTIPS